MTRRRGILAAVLAAALSCLPGVATALEASSLQVVSVDGRSVELLMTLDPTVAIPVDASVTGTMEVAGTVFPAETNLNVKDTRPRTAILVLDSSGSMKGARLAAAKKAARSFIDTVPADVQVGLIAFNDQVRTLNEPTADTGAVLDSLDGLKADGDTTLYDAIEKGLALGAGADRPRLVVLSDGADTSSKATLAAARKAAEDAGVPIDIVAIQAGTDQQEILRQFTGASGGSLLSAGGAGDLAQAFAEASKAFGVQVGLTGTIPESIDASGQPITATVSVDGRVSEKQTNLPADPGLAAASSGGGSLPLVPATSNSVVNTLWPLVPALIVFGCVLLIGLTVARNQQKARSARRVRQVLLYKTGSHVTSSLIARELVEQDKSWIDRLDERMSGSRWHARTRVAIAAAEIEMNPATWLLLRLAIGIVAIVVFALLFGSFWLGLLVGIIVGWAGTWLWLSSRGSARQKRFADELPDFLMLLASSLRAGLSFTHALDSASSQGQGEVARQMRRVLREVQVGATLDDALMDCANRMENEDLRWAVTALSIQREVGGSLSEILDVTAKTIKDRNDLQREVRTLSAEGRLSAYILIALPVGVFLFLAVFRREYVSLLWTDPRGLIMLAAIAVLMAIGVLWMRAVVRIKV